MRAKRNLAGYLNDIEHYTIALFDENEWHGSKAEASLRDDVLNNKHVGITRTHEIIIK